MTISMFQPNSLHSLPITQGKDSNQPPPSKTDTAQNQWADDTSGARRTTRATPGASSQADYPSSYSDRRLLKEVKKHFKQYAAGDGDRYVNFNELKEAAGQQPTSRTFTTHASAVAKELLNRPSLLDELDIGVGSTWREPGLKDERFDHDNLDYMINKYRETTSLESYSDKVLAKKLLSTLDELKISTTFPYDGFTLVDLKNMAAGKLHDGRDATQEQMKLAKEILNRPKLLEALDKDIDGWTGGELNWNDVALVAEDFESLNDNYLLFQLGIYYEELAAKPDTDELSFSELKEAAGELPSTRKFSSKATAVAQALLKRPDLLHKLDTGPNNKGEAGKQDEKIEGGAVDQVRLTSSRLPRRPTGPAQKGRLS